MDERLIKLFDEELRHLRETAREFGRAFPHKAPGLALEQSPADPYVERLLEGAAFLAARVRLKLDAQFPQITQSLLETIYPDLVAPVPSLAILRLDPAPGAVPAAPGTLIRRGSRVRAVPRRVDEHTQRRGEPTACVFSVCQDVRLLPIQLVQAEWLVRRVHDSGADADFGARAALRLRIRKTTPAPWAEIGLDPLVVHLPAGTGDDLGFDLFQALFAHQMGLALRDGPGADARSVFVRAGEGVSRYGMEATAAVLPEVPRTFRGYRLLREYFALPERFLFFRIAGFRKALAECRGETLDFVVPLREGSGQFEREVDARRFALFCTPVVNLFAKRFPRVIEPERFSEFHVVPDTNRPLDFEVHSIAGVEGFGESEVLGRRFHPFFRTRYRQPEGDAFFTVSRRPRMPTDRERREGIEVAYPGSDVFISLVDARQAPFAGDLRQLSFETECTNRHLPIQLRDGNGLWSVEGGIKAEITVLTGPTLPSFQPVDGSHAWQLLGVFSLNYLSLAGETPNGVPALRELLALHAPPRAEWASRQIGFLRRVHSRPVVRPLYAPPERDLPPAIAAMVRGLEVAVEFEEAALHDRRLFVLGSVLDEFFAKYVTLNSFTETVIRAWPDGREWARWSARPGLRGLV